MFPNRDFQQVAKATLQSRPVLHKIRDGKIRCGRKIRTKYIKGPVTCKTCQKLIIWDRENANRNKRWKKLGLKTEFCIKKHSKSPEIELIIKDDIEIKVCKICN